MKWGIYSLVDSRTSIIVLIVFVPQRSSLLSCRCQTLKAPCVRK